MSGCDHCGEPIIVTSRNPNRRFCTTHCRRADWRSRQRTRDQHNLATDGVGGDGLTSDVVPHDVGPGNGLAAGGLVHGDDPTHALPSNTVDGPNTTTRCPHCGNHVTVLVWMLPPAAAHVTPPRHG